jgi:hypothetical protein
MTRLPVVFALALALHLSAHAADMLPAHVTGSWSTAATPDAANGAQTAMHLQADGYGLLIGTAPTKRIAGVDDGKPLPQIVMGFPVRATLDGDTLRLQPFLPKGAPADQAALAARASMTCRYDAAGATFACTGPDNTPFVLRREAATLAPDVAGAVAAMKAQAPDA